MDSVVLIYCVFVYTDKGKFLHSVHRKKEDADSEASSLFYSERQEEAYVEEWELK